MDLTGKQKADMTAAECAIADCAAKLETVVPDGPDKIHLMRKLREAAMWANIAAWGNHG